MSIPFPQSEICCFIMYRPIATWYAVMLATAGIHCTTSQRLSAVTENCSIVRAGSSERSVTKGGVCARHDACSAHCGTQLPLTSSVLEFVVCYFSDTSPPFIRDFLSDFLFKAGIWKVKQSDLIGIKSF